MHEVPAFERDPYLSDLEVMVTRVGGDGERPYALLDDTIMYPEGGGQPADHGRLGEAAIVDVQRVGDEIRHFLDGVVEVGPSSLRLDWQRRFDHMQQHTAQHLISAVAADELGWSTTSFHLGSLTADIELDVPEIDPETRERLEVRVNEEVRRARTITARRVSAQAFRALLEEASPSSNPRKPRTRGLPEGYAGDVRLVEIAGIDCNTCGGTHLASTAEIETVALLGTEPMRGGTRLYWLAGGRVRHRLHERETAAAALRRAFETSDAELLEVATGKLDRLGHSQRAIKLLRHQLAQETSLRLTRNPGKLISAHFDDRDAGFLQLVARELTACGDPRPAFLTAEGDSGAFFVVCAPPTRGLDLRSAAAVVAGILDGRGGGSADMIQGKAGSLRRRDDAETALTVALSPP